MINQLVNDARKEYAAKDHDKVAIYTPRSQGHDHFKRVISRPARPWESVILPGTLKENLLADTKEFLEEGDFYESRGLPYRRGYLLYGTPGSGKSSLSEMRSLCVILC